MLLLEFFSFTSFAPLLDAVLKLLSHQICRDAVESLCPVLRATPGIIRCCPLGETAAADVRHKQASVRIGLCSASQLLVFGKKLYVGESSMPSSLAVAKVMCSVPRV